MWKTVLIVVAACIALGTTAGLWIRYQNQVVTIQVTPRPYVQRFVGFQAEVREEGKGRIGIFIGSLGNCKRTDTRIEGGPSFIVDPLEDPVVYGCMNLPQSFFAESQLWVWIRIFEMEDANDSYYEMWESTALPIVFLTIEQNKIESSLSVSAFRNIRKFKDVNWYEVDWDDKETEWFEFTSFNIDPDIELLDCNLETRNFHGLSLNEPHGAVVCDELVVDDHYRYYLISTNGYPIQGSTHFLGLDKAEQVPWLIIENPFYGSD